jgi:8-oxo-dGTP diphosphatase
LIRELREELAVDAIVGSRIGPDVVTVDGTATLRTYWATITDTEPQPLEHAALRWLATHELYDVAWLAPDLPVIAEITRVLSPS